MGKPRFNACSKVLEAFGAGQYDCGILPRCSRNPAVLRLVCDRREWLRLGGLGGLALGLAPLPRTLARSAAGFARAKSVLVIFASGGQSQLETWDPKPDAPAEIRGEFASIATAVPGTRICEHLPRVARLAKRYTIVRTMSHDDLDHGSAIYWSLTGQPHQQKSANPPPRPTDYPTHGAVLRRLRRAERSPYSAVHVNGPVLAPELVAPGQFGGFLGRAYEPLLVGDVSSGPVAIPGLAPSLELPLKRQETRRALLQAVDDARRQAHADQALLDMDTMYRQAFELLESPRGQRAFDLSEEPAKVRDRYGRYRAGQSCLLGRRLVEAGIPYVTVFFNHSIRGQDKAPAETDAYGWDTHNDIFAALKEHLLPRFDLSFSALLEDMEQRGLLDTTLVICMGEFGRAPRVALEPTFAGQSPGRKHWAAVYSIVLAGAGVTAGGIVGASDRVAAYPQTQPYGPADLAATMFAALGIDPAGHYEDLTGRPYAVTTGKVIREVYG